MSERRLPLEFSSRKANKIGHCGPHNSILPFSSSIKLEIRRLLKGKKGQP